MGRPRKYPLDAGAERLVSAVRLIRPYGYVDEFGRRRDWAAGDVVGDPDEIAHLIDISAPIEFVEG